MQHLTKEQKEKLSRQISKGILRAIEKMQGTGICWSDVAAECLVQAWKALSTGGASILQKKTFFELAAGELMASEQKILDQQRQEKDAFEARLKNSYGGRSEILDADGNPMEIQPQDAAQELAEETAGA